MISNVVRFISSRKPVIELAWIKRFLRGLIQIPINIIPKQTAMTFLFLEHNMMTDRNTANAVLRACVNTLKTHSGIRDVKEIIFTYKLFAVII